MALVDSLLTAIVRSDGDALVMHVGERPYVISSAGPIDLSAHALNLGAMEGMLGQLLPSDTLRVLQEFGAVEHELSALPAMAGDRFTVVAARGGDDIWIEMRRHRRLKPASAIHRATPPAEPQQVVPEQSATVSAAPANVMREQPAALPAASEQPVEPVSATSEQSVSSATAASELSVAEPLEVYQPVAERPAPAAETPLVERSVLTEELVLDAQDVLTEEPVLPAQVALTEEPVLASQVAPAEEPASLAPDELDAPAIVESTARTVDVAPQVEATPIAEAPRDAEAPLSAVDEPQLSEVDLGAEAMAAEEIPIAVAIDVAHEVLAAEDHPTAEDFPKAEAILKAEAFLKTTVPPIAEETASAEPIAIDEEAEFAEMMAVAEESMAVQEIQIEAVDEEWVAQAALEPEPVYVGAAAQKFAQSAAAAMPETAAAPSLPRSSTDASYAEPRVAAGPAATAATEPPPADEEFAVSTVGPLRAVARLDAGPRVSSRAGGLERLLRLAASRGASALYLTSQSPPAIRVDGEVQRLAGETTLTSDDVEAAVLEILPEGSSESVRRGETTEWICDLEDIGRLRCTTFRDHRGPGALVRMISARAASAEQLGLSREIQSLATEPEGLVIVSGPRGSGKSTLVAAVVDLVNRQRADYVITLERQIRLVHEHRHSLISQREVHGHSDEVVAAARAALRENPDVLVIEDLRSPDVLQVALDAAGSGLLVVVSVTASATTAAIERLVEMVPADRRKPVQALLAETLRGAVSQVLLRKTGGGRLAARELLLSTSAVEGLVAEGQLSQLPRAIDSGRKHGMVPLNDALVAFVQSGAVDVREAYRKASDRAGLLAQLKRQGIETSFIERFA